MKLYAVDPYEWIYPDRIEEAKTRKLINPVFDIASGGACGIAVIVSGLEPGTLLSFTSDSGGCRFYKMLSVNVTVNTGEKGFTICDWSPKTQWVCREAPYRVYDALKPLAGSVTADSEDVVLYVKYTPGSKVKGLQKIRLNFDTGGSRVSLSFGVNIHNIRIPKTGRDSVCYVNWIYDIPVLAEEGKTKLWSEKFWALLGKHARLMYEGRQNTFSVPLELFYENKNGVRRINVKNLRRYIETFTEAGLYWIEGMHLAKRVNGEWNAVDFNVIGTEYAVSSAEGEEELAKYLRPLRKVIDENGWDGRWFQHATDEPTDCNATAYRILTGIIRKYLPGIPIVDANISTKITGALDIWCPQVQDYQMYKEFYDKRLLNGDTLWAYVCCLPGGKYLNRFLDHELLRPLLLGWGCAANNIQGFLHYGWNYYPADCDSLEVTTLNWGSADLPPGDSHIIYSDKENGEPWGSMRLEAHRAGMEAWEAIKILQNKAPGKAESVIREVFRAFNDYTTETKTVRKAERKLYKLLS